MSQIDPDQMSEKQMSKIIEIYKEWYNQSEPIVKINEEHSDVLSHPEKDPDLYNYLCTYQDDLFIEGLFESGLFEVYWEVVDKQRLKNSGPYTNEEREEMSELPF